MPKKTPLNLTLPNVILPRHLRMAQTPTVQLPVCNIMLDRNLHMLQDWIHTEKKHCPSNRKTLEIAAK